MKTNYLNNKQLEPITLGAAAITAGATLAGQGMGMANAAARNRKQFKYQQKLMDKAYGQNQQMALFNADLQRKLWEDTNYSAQMEQIKKAGLNPALLYGTGAGAGGTTQAAQGQGMGVPQAPTQESGAEFGGMGMQLAAMAMRTQAEVDLMKAQARNLEANTNKTAGIDTEVAGANLNNIIQNTQNQQTANELMQIQKEFDTIKLKIKQGTQMEETDSLLATYRMAEHKLNILINDEAVSNETFTEAINQSRLQTIEMGLKNESIKKGIDLTDAQINKIAKDILQRGEEIAVSQRNASTNEQAQALNEKIKDIPDSTKLMVEAGGKVADFVIKILTKGGKK